MTHTIIEVKDLHVRLGSSHILRGVNLTLAAGESLAVLGANGSGKSTLIKTLVTINPVESGDVLLFGQSTSERNKLPWDKIGYAPQHMTSTSGVPATALETVTSGLIYGRRVRPGKGAREKALAALDLVGLKDRADEPLQNFSGGQQQRTLIARALVKNPELIILDEPFSGVDRESQESITEVLATAREAGATLVLILHELYNLEPLIDHAIVLDHGVVAARYDNPHDVEPVGEHAFPDHAHQHEHGFDKPHFRTPWLGGAV